MPIFEHDDKFDPYEFLRQQIELDKKIERLKKIREEQRRADIEWLETAYDEEE